MTIVTSTVITFLLKMTIGSIIANFTIITILEILITTSISTIILIYSFILTTIAAIITIMTTTGLPAFVAPFAKR